jgi:fatty acid desaturase
VKLTDALTREEVARLSKPSDLHGWLSVLTTWAMIAGSFTAVAWWPSIWTALGALVILGGRHLALALLMHDASHYSLFKTRWLNDWVGRWLCSYPTWQDLRRYRVHHLRHHRFAGSAQDPDLDLVEPFPITRASLARKLIRDLSGLSGVKRLIGLLKMEFGFVEYTVSAKLVPIRGSYSWKSRFKLAISNMYGLVLTNALLFEVLWACGYPELYWLWVLSWLTTFSAFIRIRSIAEHACTVMDLDPMKSTRTTLANPLARVTVAPHRANYHLEHHLMANVPSYYLHRMHRLLMQRGALEGAYVASGYIDVLKLASSKSR